MSQTQQATTARKKRHDPPPPADSRSLYILGLRNQDPRMHYAWVNTNDQRTGVARFEMMGYEAVLYEPGGVTPSVGAKRLVAGQEIVVEGNVLMCCTKEHKAQLNQHGGRGSGLGLDWANELEGKIIKTQKQGDHMRGQFRASVAGRGYREMSSEDSEQT